MGKLYVIGLGSKARQGKDTVANFIKEQRKNVIILHWADALYEEIKNSDRKYPLIIRHAFGDDAYYKSYYFLLNDSTEGLYNFYHESKVPYLDKIMRENRGISKYLGMDEKDPEMLQFWGTDYRRKMCGNDYWVNKLEETILSRMQKTHHQEDVYVCIADTRFKNELQCIQKFHDGVFLRIIRTNEDGSQYQDENRDSNHPSECDLDGISADYTLTAKTGDLESLKKQTEIFLNSLDKL